MSKKERIKTVLDFIKAGMFALLTALFGIFAFVVVNVESINTFQVIASVLGIILIAVAMYFLVRHLIKKLNELEKLE